MIDSTGSKKSAVNFDIGTKLVIDNLRKFSFSGELILRTYLKKVNNEESKVRYTLNVGYELMPNYLITFNIGKEFDKKAETGGTLIAALNLVLGFGSLRPF
jgi:hypothetical protein